MPFPLLLIALIFGGISRIFRAVAEENERRDRSEAQELYYQRQQELNDRPYRERISTPIPPTPAPQPDPTPTANRKARRFTLVIPLADNQIAIALRPIRAAAMVEHPQISGVTFTAEPGGSVVELIVTLDEGSSIDESALEEIFQRAGQALHHGYRAG